MEPVACTLKPAQMGDRLAAGAALTARGLIDYERISDGYRLRFEPQVRGDLEDLVAAESRCCTFMEFGLESVSGELVVDIRAPEAGRPLIAELFGIVRAENR